MKIPEHLTLSYLLAQLGPQQEYGLAGTLLVMTAGMLPDLDGLSVLAGWKAHLKYHRKIGHGVPMTLFGPLLLALGWSTQLEDHSWLPLWAWCQLSLLLHLFVDVLFYRWKVQLLWPFAEWGIGLGLVYWNDLVPTLLLYTNTASALLWPDAAVHIAAGTLGVLALYVLWRAMRRDPETGWLRWLMRDWAPHSPRLCRWLTGDFIT
jgi:membrane-bound metal-dependent hydrolase YbcI (DUF457 family)